MHIIPALQSPWLTPTPGSSPLRGQGGLRLPGRGPASRHAARLLESLGAQAQLGAAAETDAAALAAHCGLMTLTGEPGSPPEPCPAPLAACARGAGLAWAAAFGHGPLDTLDGARLLTERAALMGLQRRGRIAPGGSCRLLQTADGWIALNLARDEDRAALPAWLAELPGGFDGDESALPAAVRPLDTASLIERGRLLELAIADARRPAAAAARWYTVSHSGPAAAPPRHAPRVLDLSALWAGPLCAQLLRLAGADVVKLESRSRPDGARRGNTAFYDRLNHGKRSVAIDFASRDGLAQLAALIDAADIVIESTRPRALRQLGIVAEDFVDAQPGRVWLSLSGYGRDGEAHNRIAFGDDAAAAAGLCALMNDSCGTPLFVGDAIADPLSGLHAALLAWVAYQSGGGALLSVALHDVISWCCAETLQLDAAALREQRREVLRRVASGELQPLPPAAPARSPAAAPLGADNAAVCADWLGC